MLQYAFCLITTTFVASVLVICYSQIRKLLHNIAEARSSGFYYLITPFYPFSLPWVLVQPILVPILTSLPARWTQPWLTLLQFNRGWHYGYMPFRDVGVDTFMLVSPEGNILFTCDPDAAQQLFRNNALGKPLELMGMLNIFGPTMTGTDGQESRLYRKLSAPFFSEDTMHRVWESSISSAEAFLEVVGGHNEELRPIIARMTLHLLSTVCFESKKKCIDELDFRMPAPSGHQLSYSHAMAATLEYLPTIFLTPPSILKISPLSVHKRAHQAYTEIRSYIEELRDWKQSSTRNGSVVSDPSLLDMIVHGGRDLIEPPAVLGNIFIFMFAGHEANANTLTFIFLLLACHPDIQALLQADIDKVLGSLPPSQWSYEAHYSLLSTCHVGAVINETSRLFTVLPFLPKKIPPTPQSLNLDNKNYVLPPNMLVLINTSAVHRHPSFWPKPQQQNSSTTSNPSHPVASFNPAYWLNPPTAEDDEEKRESFLHPRPGTFIPFSDGNRGCLGKRFALVEMVAVVARVFSEYSIELAVDSAENASEEEVKSEWEKARKKAEYELSAGVEFKLSLRMTGKVPVRFFKRNKGKFS